MLGAVSVDPATIIVPDDLLPSDGRFGCGPSKVRPEQVDAVVAARSTILGTSHRQPAVKDLVGSVRAGLAELFSLPDGWEIVLGNGGSTVFWDVATFGLIRDRSQHLVFGEFSSKFADAAAAAPHLGEPTVISSETGSHPEATAEDGIDLYALTHNETSTGVAMDLRRPAGTRRTPRWSPSTPPLQPAACAGIPPRSTSTTSRRRSASPPTAACGSPPARRQRSSASTRSAAATAGGRHRSTCRSHSTTRPRTRPTTPRRSPPW